MTTINRRKVLQASGAAAAIIAAPGLLRAQAAPIKIGILQPVTGALAQDGEYGRLGAEIAINEINAAGGIKGLGGARIEMVFGDARSNPEGGQAEVERMHSIETNAGKLLSLFQSVLNVVELGAPSSSTNPEN